MLVGTIYINPEPICTQVDAYEVISRLNVSCVDVYTEYEV